MFYHQKVARVRVFADIRHFALRARHSLRNRLTQPLPPTTSPQRGRGNAANRRRHLCYGPVTRALKPGRGCLCDPALLWRLVLRSEWAVHRQEVIGMALPLPLSPPLPQTLAQGHPRSTHNSEHQLCARPKGEVPPGP